MKIVITEEQLKLLTEISKSKKLSKYVQFSTALDWYRDNKLKIAEILGVNPDDLATEEEIISQSEGLIINVINPQSSGRRSSNTIDGFKEFVKLEKNILHDLLHNLFEVHEKEFKKSLNDLEFDESEIVEEIEILGIEESFMKYMGMRYPNPDFINQNINQLVSYLIPTIIQDDPERIEGIIEGRIEPYLEINGKKYPTKGTPYEGVFEDILKSFPKDIYDEDSEPVENYEEFKETLRDILKVGEGISESGGDRTNFPDGGYYGDLDWNDVYQGLDYSEQKEYTKNAIDYHYYLRDIDQYVEDEFELQKEDKVQEFIDELNEELEDNEEERKIESEDDLNDEEKKRLEEFLDEYKEEIKDNIDDDYKFEDADGTEYVVFDSAKNLVDYSSDWEVDNTLKETMYEEGLLEFEPDEIDPTLTVEELIDRIKDDNNAFSIFRRYFRRNTVTTNITNKGGRGKQQKYTLNRDVDYPSISKYLMTDNAKKLYVLLSNFRGYVIKNQDKIKQDYLAFEKAARDLKNKLPKVPYRDGLEVGSDLIDLANLLKDNYVNFTKDFFRVVHNLENVRYKNYDLDENPAFKGFVMTAKEVIKVAQRVKYNDLLKMKMILVSFLDDERFKHYFKNFVVRFNSETASKRQNLQDILDLFFKDKNIEDNLRKFITICQRIAETYRIANDISNSNYTISKNSFEPLLSKLDGTEEYELNQSNINMILNKITKELEVSTKQTIKSLVNLDLLNFKMDKKAIMDLINDGQIGIKVYYDENGNKIIRRTVHIERLLLELKRKIHGASSSTFYPNYITYEINFKPVFYGQVTVKEN
jgi:hypothetical protein